MKLLNWIGFGLSVIMALLFFVPVYSFKDERWDGEVWLIASVTFLIFAVYFARNASKTDISRNS